METINYSDFVERSIRPLGRKPVFGQIELTYRCHFRCVHCYCKNGDRREESIVFWKGVINQISSMGGIEITFTGGDPLCYKGFLDIYRYAIAKGFIVNVFTSGVVLNKDILNCFKRHSPALIEITLNSLEKDNYSRITGTKGLFDRVINNIKKLKSNHLPLILKCNGLKENKHEILAIKRFSEKLLGKNMFKFDSFIFPGLKGEKEPIRHRLEAGDIIDIEKSDADMLKQAFKQSQGRRQWFNPQGLYHCNSWLRSYFINPQGILQFCHLTKEHSTDLKKHSFKSGFEKFADILKEKYKKESMCVDCSLKELCYKCPSRAYLENKDKESPVEYYCQLAQARSKFIGELRSYNTIDD
jgi:radical SAM protein with 4Fe4S-binding SPASM domain